ncbi:MAG: DNA polymerase I [Candidatus Eisenbacteria bacterium]
MAKLLLVDGPAVAYRSHYALAKWDLTGSSGESTAATFGYISTLLKLLREQNPEYVCVAFDTKEPTFRHEMYEDYKAGRPETPEDLAGQFEQIMDLTEAMGIRVVGIDGYEADDIIGTLAHMAGEAGISTVIATGDKDMLQLVNTGTRVIMFSGSGRDTKIIDEKGVVAKYGITPALLPDFFALMGDAVDNIPGVPGIGPKTAGVLVKEHGGLELIYENLENVSAKRARTVLAENREAAFSSRDLVRIDTKVPVGLAMEDFRRGAVNEGRIKTAFIELGFRSLLRQICGERDTIEVDPEIWQDGLLGSSTGELKCDRGVGIEVNLEGTTASTSPILGVAVCCEGGGEYYFPLNHREPVNVSDESFRSAAAGLLSDAGAPKVVHDAKKVTIALERLGIKVGGIEFDTLLAGYLLNPGRRNLDVVAIAAEYLGKFLDDGVTTGSGNSLVTLKHASERCCTSAKIGLDARGAMEEDLKKRGLWDLFIGTEMPLTEVLAGMELRGVKIDRARLGRLSTDIDKRLAGIEKDAFALAGRQFNLNSPKDISQLLFDEMGLKPRRKTKTGYSTDTSVLTELSCEHELPGKILEHRQLAKIKSTYVDQLLHFADPSTDRIHANFNQTVTATGRLSSSDPNLQNIPIRSDLGAEMRKAFIPGRPDWMFVSADYSQIELRILAHLSGDEALTEAFSRGDDIHTSTACFIFKVDPPAVTTAMRSIAKSVNFGIVYGMGVQGLARAAGLSLEEAEGFLAEHRRNYPGVYAYIDGMLKTARENGYVETILGRKRFLPNLASSEPSLRSAAERMAVNTPVQGSAADIIKVAMLGVCDEIETRRLEGGIVIQVHDEILIDCPETEREQFEEILSDRMSGAYILRVPLKVDVSSGRNWYEAH